MPLESGKNRPASPTGAHPTEPEHHPCPRCESTNTKFCYYNNYNLSQPRHFCKSCRRYWTRGGALRNIPVGGGTRKRSRAATNTVAASSSSSSSSISTHDPKPGTPIAMVPGFIKSEMGAPVSVGVNLNQIAGPESGGFWGFGGLGLGFGPGFPEMGFGLAPPVWPMEQIGEVNGGGGGGGSVSGGSSGCNTWQMGGVDGGLADGDCFGWPDLSISTPGKCLK